MPQTATGSLDSAGKLRLTLGDCTLALTATGCRSWSDTLTLCNDTVQLEISSPQTGKVQMLSLDSIYLSSENTAYRGPLVEGYRENRYTFVVGDIDGDGADDLMVWTGKDGGYGGASYDVYLFDSATGQYVHNQALSDLTIGTTAPFHIENGKLKTASVDGASLRVFETYQLENGEPVLVERVTEERLDDAGQSTVKTERLIDGQMKEVESAAAGQ